MNNSRIQTSPITIILICWHCSYTCYCCCGRCLPLLCLFVLFGTTYWVNPNLYAYYPPLNPRIFPLKSVYIYVSVSEQCQCVYPVDKRNANDVCSMAKLTQPDPDFPIPIATKSNANLNLNINSSVAALGAPHSPTSAASAALLLLESSCDGNRNDESRFPGSGKSNNLFAPLASLSLSSQFPLCIFN